MTTRFSHALRTALVCALALACETAVAGSGKAFYDELVKQDGLLEDPEIVDYVRRVGQRLVDVSEMSGREFHFYVVDSDVVNAQAHEDAYVFVYRGLLAHMETEAQLAGVLGHEIGHVTARHMAGRKSRAALSKVAGLAAAVLTGRGELMRVADTAGAAWVTGYGRDQELQADQYGARYLALAGYDPYAMVEVVQVLKDRGDYARKVNPGAQNYHGLFASHPKNDRRLQEVVSEAEHYVTQEYVEPVGDLLSLLDGLMWGDAASGGVIVDNVYYHGEIGFVVTFPEDWRLYDSARQLSANPAGVRDVFVTVEVQNVEDSRRMDPEKYMKDYLAVKDVVQGAEVSYEEDGMKGYVATLAPAEDPEGAVRTMAVVFRQGRALIFKGEAAPGEYSDTFVDTFGEIVAGLRSMQRADVKKINTQRIAVVEAKPGDTYESLARTSPLKGDAAAQLRLINGDYPNGQPRAGDRIKIVR